MYRSLQKSINLIIFQIINEDGLVKIAFYYFFVIPVQVGIIEKKIFYHAINKDQCEKKINIIKSVGAFWGIATG